MFSLSGNSLFVDGETTGDNSAPCSSSQEEGDGRVLGEEGGGSSARCQREHTSPLRGLGRRPSGGRLSGII